MKTLIAALFAATALVPVAAHAQEMRPREEARPEGGDVQQPRGERQHWQRREGEGQRPQFQPAEQRQPQAAAPPPPQARQDPGQWRQGNNEGGRPDWRRDGGPRPDQGARGDGGPRPDQDRGGHAAWRQPPPQDRVAPNGGFAGRGDDRRDWNRDRDDRRDRSAVISRQPNGQWGRDDRNWRGNDARNPGGFDNGRNWNRGWRTDNRYDWNRYRTSNRSLYRLPRYYAPYGWGYGYRRFSIGVTLSQVLWDDRYWLDDPIAYRLPPAYGPYRWVRYYDDALLVDLRTGRVVDAVYDIFY